MRNKILLISSIIAVAILFVSAQSNVVKGASAAGFGQPAIYNATLPTLTSGSFGGLEVDQNGYLYTTPNFSYYATSTAQVGVIKASAGVLHSLSVLGTTTLTNIGLYDGSTVYGGTLIGTTTIGDVGNESYIFDTKFTNGLSIAVTGTGVSLVVSYR